MSFDESTGLPSPPNLMGTWAAASFARFLESATVRRQMEGKASC